MFFGILPPYSSPILQIISVIIRILSRSELDGRPSTLSAWFLIFSISFLAICGYSSKIVNLALSNSASNDSLFLIKWAIPDFKNISNPSPVI